MENFFSLYKVSAAHAFSWAFFVKGVLKSKRAFGKKEEKEKA
ncbi:hypothetical protein Bandiella_00702 [Candidatus Bandiella woodruffii]|uniref:Uncharacterized protein n=1 Tax=Candidatus Bandiella euplotis TaxID=1664265 RepID=A0ABZ0UP06_9RICK|nr:hypothetical protein Bandiella_00702 [Candidatus Bandiella woodruffii]